MVVGIPPGFVVFGCSCLSGVTEDGERTIILAMEQPERLASFPERVDKNVLERFHLERFRSDYLLRNGTVPFNSVQDGGDPPDFIVSNDHGVSGLDCVVMAQQQRRTAYQLLAHLEQRLDAVSGDRDFSGVAGCVVSIWFGENLAELPPRRTDDSIIEPLLDELENATVDHQAIDALLATVAASGFPEILPPVITQGTTPDGSAGFVANRLVAPAHAGQIPGGRGFQIGLHTPQQWRESELQAQLQRITSDHDKPEIEHLLVTAGGPDPNGIRYPGEEAYAAFLVERDDLMISAEHLTQVTLHLWSTGEIVDIKVRRPTK